MTKEEIETLIDEKIRQVALLGKGGNVADVVLAVLGFANVPIIVVIYDAQWNEGVLTTQVRYEGPQMLATRTGMYFEWLEENKRYTGFSAPDPTTNPEYPIRFSPDTSELNITEPIGTGFTSCRIYIVKFSVPEP